MLGENKKLVEQPCDLRYAEEALHHMQQGEISAGLQQLSPWTAMASLVVVCVPKHHLHLQMDKQTLYEF